MNKVGKLWELVDPHELRISYPYGIYHIEGNQYQFINRDYSDLDSELPPHNGGRTGKHRLTLSEAQLFRLELLCDKVGPSFFLYNDRTYPWGNEHDFDQYFNKYYEVKKVLGI